ncbi:acyltransferase [Shewanella chilikensis]|uniref:acyltransferase n=1 Tax=Shewanella chilikensis TaxID=558541 RepID=UPI002010457A|nr:acyltransferase [Shewanella chilikensis]MCL1160662.1 acyltransferase [Shewanella chilikensis]
MKRKIIDLLILLFSAIKLYRLIDLFFYAVSQSKIRLINKSINGNLDFIPQGGFYFDIVGDLSKLKVGKQCHIKSSTFIECSGGLEIGDYFHTGRNLTIYTTEHVWKNATTIPYNTQSEPRKVTIGDCVWLGANVTIMPGATIEDGVVVGAGSVIRGRISKGSVIIGNPCETVSRRDLELFDRLKLEGKFF